MDVVHYDTLTPLNLTKHYCRKNWSKSDYIIDTGPIHVTRTESLARQHHRRGLAWMVNALVCEGSRDQFQGEPPLLMMSVSNEIG